MRIASEGRPTGCITAGRGTVVLLCDISRCGLPQPFGSPYILIAILTSLFPRTVIDVKLNPSAQKASEGSSCSC